MSWLSQPIARRSFMSAAVAGCAVIALGNPVQATRLLDPYRIQTWENFPGQTVVINGRPTYVRQVTRGIGLAFHVHFDGSRLEEGLWTVFHPMIGAVELFICVQGNHAISTFNSTKEP